ncbi:atpase family protein [Anaeramoeba flamelloides]|uniref:Atpase family protein n=1 Tax=Anaeramoeba flamelloides TaxID=1746091 RepID=A0ABQ8XPN5_9EUKA|nr:atpase family protein [Anaeramoeba flamelloides]
MSTRSAARKRKRKKLKQNKTPNSQNRNDLQNIKRTEFNFENALKSLELNLITNLPKPSTKKTTLTQKIFLSQYDMKSRGIVNGTLAFVSSTPRTIENFDKESENENEFGLVKEKQVEKEKQEEKEEPIEDQEGKLEEEDLKQRKQEKQMEKEKQEEKEELIELQQDKLEEEDLNLTNTEKQIKELKANENDSTNEMNENEIIGITIPTRLIKQGQIYIPNEDLIQNLFGKIQMNKENKQKDHNMKIYLYPFSSKILIGQATEIVLETTSVTNIEEKEKEKEEEEEEEQVEKKEVEKEKNNYNENNNEKKDFEIKTQKLQNILRLHYVKSNLKLKIPFFGKIFNFQVSSYQPKQFQIVQINSKTKIIVNKKNKEDKSSNLKKFILNSIQLSKYKNFSQIGGLNDEISKLKEFYDLPIKKHNLYTKYRLEQNRAVLLTGRSGTGKTLLGQALLKYVGEPHAIYLSGSQLLELKEGTLEELLNQLLNEIRNSLPCVLFIDEIEYLCPKREKLTTEKARRNVDLFFQFLDNLLKKSSKNNNDNNNNNNNDNNKGNNYDNNLLNRKDINLETKNILFIGATNNLNKLDNGLTISGRLDHQINLSSPNSKNRFQILKILLKNLKSNISEKQLLKISSQTHGFVGSDLFSLIKTTYRISLKKKEKILQFEDLKKAKALIKPSAIKDVIIQVPQINWKQIGGMEIIKTQLRESVEFPLKFPEAFKRMGCGKTMLVKALATESHLNFLAVKGPELYSKWVGESEKAIREVFRKARLVSPSIIFFDEIDSIAIHRGSNSGGTGVTDRVLSQMLFEMDGIESLQNVTIVGATNRPDMIDKALIRPGRFDRVIYVPPPDLEARKSILQICFSKIKIEQNGETIINKLAELTEGYSGAEIVSICTDAGLCAIEEDQNTQIILIKHIWKAFERVKPRISKEMISFYKNFQKKHSRK